MLIFPRRRFAATLASLLAVVSLGASSAAAQVGSHGSVEGTPDAVRATEYIPPALAKAREAAGVDEKLRDALPLDATFTDSAGRTVRLGDYFNRGRPVIIQMAYYRCPMLCGRVAQGMVTSMGALSKDLVVGRDFDVLTVSFDSRESSELAAENKAAVVEVMSRSSPAASVESGWAHLVGDDLSIKTLVAALGYRFGWIEEAQEYSHPAVLVLCTPDGRISRYMYGVSFDATDLRLSLINASQGTITPSLKDAFILNCFDFDPKTGKYTATARTLMRIAGVTTVLTLVSVVGFMLVAERKGKLRRHKYAGTPAEDDDEAPPSPPRSAFSR